MFFGIEPVQPVAAGRPKHARQLPRLCSYLTIYGQKAQNMADSNQPSFLGGLPPRQSATTIDQDAAAEVDEVSEQRRDQPRPPLKERINTLSVVSFVGAFFVALLGIIGGLAALKQIQRTGQRGRGFALAGVIVGAINMVVFVVGALLLVLSGAAFMSLFDEKPTVAVEQPVSAEEAAAAEEAIASGGGAVPGHIVSGDLCAAINGYIASADESLTSLEVSPETISALEIVAAVPSPNQLAYQAALGLLKDPASVPSIADAQAIATDLAEAVQIDVMTCA